MHRILTEMGIPYVVIGGIAVQCWGEPRFTRDVDVTVLAPLGEEEDVIRRILAAFKPRIGDALEFALRNRVCLVEVRGTAVDISLGLPGYEEEVMRRAIAYNVGGGRTVQVCSPEDLVVHKAVAGRPQDIQDIEGVVLRQGDKLDVEYIRKWLREFSFVLEEPEISERFERVWKKFVEDREAR